MIIGNGQLAKAFTKRDQENTVIFASGVANSKCTEQAQFERERDLLLKTLSQNPEKTLAYFSSCALSSQTYPKNPYYDHKAKMEALIAAHTKNYYIFRIPQLFGKLKKHNTLINYLYMQIANGETFSIYNDAHRYVVEIEDVVTFVCEYLKVKPSVRVIDVANMYRYSIMEIVEILEELTGRKAHYDVVEKSDHYTLDLTSMERFLEEHHLDLGFSKGYLFVKLKQQFDTLEA